MTQGLHRLLGALDQLKRTAASGVCALPSCRESAIGYIQGWDLRPRGVCATHAPGASALGYTVHRVEEK